MIPGKATNMKVIKQKEADVLTVKIEGSLDINTSPELRSELISEIEEVKEVIFDLGDTVYTSSAGLRVILETFQILRKNGGNMMMINVNSDFYETLKLAGFTEFIDIKQAQEK